MRRYAEKTQVSSEKSRAEIEKTLQRYGASGFLYGQQGDRAIIAFEMHDRRVKFILPMPDPLDREFTHTPGRGSKRHPDDARKQWELSCRQRWRALALAVKAKLEAVESGITTFEEEFLAHICLPNGKTVHGWFAPQLEVAYQSGQMPPLLEGPR